MSVTTAVRALLDRRPAAFVVVFWLAVAALLGSVYLPQFRLSAGSETLRLENDDSLDVYDESRRWFTDDEYVLVAVAPPDPWSPAGIETVTNLTRELEAVEWEGRPAVTRVLSPATVPLMLSARSGGVTMHVLSDPEIDPEFARRELTESQVYSRNVVSEDGETFNLLAYLEPFSKWADEPPDGAPRAERIEYQDRKGAFKRGVVGAVREVMARHREGGSRIQASGLPAVTVDMVDYVERDIRTFGWVVLLFVLGALFAFFRKPRFVVLPVLTGLVTVVSVLGSMVALGVETTVVSSNISSLLFIVGMAHSIHVVVAYREQRAEHGEQPHADTLASAVAAIWHPCLYTALTTCVGFASLHFTDVAPVRQFGYAMAAGALLSFAASMTFLPCALALLGPTEERAADDSLRVRLLDACARWATRHRLLVYAASLALVIVAGVGIARLRVDTSFVDYFVESTDVHQGIEWVDRVGGTMTLEVIFPPEEKRTAFLDPEGYGRIERLHRWFDEQPETGKTMSLVSFVSYGREIATTASPLAARMPPRGLWTMAEHMLKSGGEDAARLQDAVAMVLAQDTAEGGDSLWRTRVQVRIRETGFPLRRSEFMDRLHTFLREEMDVGEGVGVKADGTIVTGMFVQFTNMLDTVVVSQVRSFGVVFVAVGIMLVLLLRHLAAGLLAMIPNVLPIAMVLGVMGLVGITLDIMTITIASVSLGIAADATIHYIVRFRHEVRRLPAAAAGETVDLRPAARAAHRSIGRAILFSALTVIAGFLVLVLSRFTPTIWFGLLVGVAMVAGLLADLVLLPALLVTCRVFAGEAGRDATSAPDDGPRDADQA